MRLSDIKDDQFYEIESLGLLIPGKQLKCPDVFRAIRAEIHRLEEKKREESRYYPGWHNAQVFKYSDNPPAYVITPKFAGVRHLIQELDLPQDQESVYFSRLFKARDFIKFALRHSNKNFENYAVEVFGLKINLSEPLPTGIWLPPTPDPSQYKCPPMYWQEYDMRLIQIWRIRVFACPVELIQTSPSNPFSSLSPNVLYFEERWHPKRIIERNLFGLEHLAELHISVERFYEGAMEIVSGRPKKSTRFTGDSFKRKYEEKYSEVSREYGCIPKKGAVARAMGISRSSFYTYLDEFDLPWPPLI